MAGISSIAIGVGHRVVARPQSELALFCFVLVLIIGYIDYVTGVWVSLSVLYVLPIAIGAWYLGRGYAYALAGASAVVWMTGDAVSGAPYPSAVVLAWNGSIRLCFYVILIVVLCRLRDLQTDLGRHVRERTAALTAEIAERQRLERQMMEIGERERRRVGQEVHDSLCQHLTGTALVAQVLAERLSATDPAKAGEALKLVGLIEDGISLARAISKGLQPVEIRPGGLMQALEEFAATTAQMNRIACEFECETPVLVESPAAATHLYRIAQEAVSNAIRHGRASRVVVVLGIADQGLCLTVSDNGLGLPASPNPLGGVGIRIMTDRAKVLGGTLHVKRRGEGGTEMLCVIPSPEGKESHD